MLLKWLGEDGILSPKDIDAVMQRFAAGTSAQHPLVRLASLGLKRADTGVALQGATANGLPAFIPMAGAGATFVLNSVAGGTVEAIWF